MIKSLAALLVAVACGCPGPSEPTTPTTPPPSPTANGATASGTPTSPPPTTAGEEPDQPQVGTEEPVEPTPESIGSASMEQDGTIVLTLRAEGPNGIVGDAQFRYPPGHEKHAEVRDHVGGLEPGESKPCPPWPEGE